MMNESEKFTYNSSLLSHEEREQIRLVLLNNIEVFTWSHSNMVGVNPTVASHKLNIILMARPIRQKVRLFHPRPPSNHSDISRQLIERWFHQRSEVPRMASQRGSGSKERR